MKPISQTIIWPIIIISANVVHNYDLKTDQNKGSEESAMKVIQEVRNKTIWLDTVTYNYDAPKTTFFRTVKQDGNVEKLSKKKPDRLR